MENRGAWVTYVGVGVMFGWPALLVLGSLAGGVVQDVIFTGSRAVIALLVITTPLTLGYMLFVHKVRRPKPDGYVGFFRRPDGLEVHVARVGGQLMVISQEKPGVFPRNLGDVTGRELAAWQKLRATPDD